MSGSNLHTDLQTRQMVLKFGLKPCEHLLLLSRSKLNALIWQEFRNPNKSTDSSSLHRVSHCEEWNGPVCSHGPAPTFKVKCVSKLPKGNYSQSSLSLVLIPYCWNSTSLSAQGWGPHAVTSSGLSSIQVISGAILLQRRIRVYTCRVRTELSQPTSKYWMELTLPPKPVLIFFLHLEGNAKV